MENENITNDSTVNVEEVVNNVIAAIDKRTEKVSNSIANDNFSKLSDDDRELAFSLLNEKRNREKNKEKEAFLKLQKERDDYLAQLNNYKQKERETILKDNSKKVLNELEIVDDKQINMIFDLSNSKLVDCLDSENNFDVEKSKEIFNEVIEKYGLKQESKEKNDYIKIGSSGQDNSNKKTNDELYEKMKKMIGL